MEGRTIRLKRLFPNPQRKLFSVPLDHPVSMGPIDGLEEIAPLAAELQEAGADLLIVTKGAVREIAPILAPTTKLGIHVSASTSLGTTSNRKVLVGTAEEAVSLGADLLSVQVNFGIPDEPDMLRDLGVAVDQCRKLGLPLLCMAYVKKPGAVSPDELRHAARAAADTGADIVKTSYPGSPEEFAKLCRTTPAPVLIGGGVRLDDPEAFLAIVRESVRAGGAGICIGRNLFQRPPVGPMARRVASLLHGVE
ncbi:MAG TPA: fructose-bisphosphate aldolase [Thermoplasmata archaeon]|jgi:DhnA family fructose-bisphosphate aldolase class Ia|nr:fructose-bisphosphate aldolase [Thermoplasmata archaeon]